MVKRYIRGMSKEPPPAGRSQGGMAGKTVVTVQEVRFALGHIIPAGSVGTVRRDEGGEDVIVEFDREVPDGGFHLPDKQAWVPRGSLGIECPSTVGAGPACRGR